MNFDGQLHRQRYRKCCTVAGDGGADFFLGFPTPLAAVSAPAKLGNSPKTLLASTLRTPGGFPNASP